MSSSEFRFLLAAASSSFDQSRSVWKSLQTELPIEWGRLLHEAGRHGMRPLLVRCLNCFPSSQIPEAVRAELQMQQQRLAVRNLNLTGELWALLQLFESHGIEALPVKGPTLSMLAFSDVAGRQFCDLDVLVAERDLAQCARLLLMRGYRTWAPMESVQAPVFLRITNVLEFSHPEKGYLVELHWRLSETLLPLDMSGAWRERRLVVTSPGGKRMSTFAPEPLLLYLSVHATKHCWLKLNWAADIAWLIQRHPDFDWAYLIALARRERCWRALKLALVLARDRLGATLPREVSRELDGDRKMAVLAKRVVHWWTLPVQQAPAPENKRWERTRFFFEIQDDWKERCRYLARLLFAPNLNDWMFVHLPARWIALYLALRPLRFLLGLLHSPKSPLKRQQS
jgi:hypothetical protein